MPAASQRTQAPPLTDTRRQQGGRPEVRLEAAPLPSPTPPAGGGGAARGPRQNERRGPAHHERPSLTWRGLSPSPGERHITTSISPGRAREEPRRGEGGRASKDNHHGGLLQLHRHPLLLLLLPFLSQGRDSG